MVTKKPRFRRKTKSSSEDSSVLNSSDLVLGLMYESFWSDKSLYDDAERNYYQHVVTQQKTGFMDKRKNSKSLVGKPRIRKKTQSSSEGHTRSCLAVNLTQDDFWMDKHLYNDAEKDYYMYLQQVTSAVKAKAFSDIWELNFFQPAEDNLIFKAKLKRDNVALENAEMKKAKNKMTGKIKVKNISFHKVVRVRYTKNNWRTHEDTLAKYLSSQFSHDTFTFDITLPPPHMADKIEFCICYETDGNKYWDNNSEKNYAIGVCRSGSQLSKPKENKKIVSRPRTISTSMKNKKSNTTSHNKNGDLNNKKDSRYKNIVGDLSEDLSKMKIKTNKKDSEKQQKEVKFNIQSNQGRKRTKSLMNPTKEVQYKEYVSDVRIRKLSTSEQLTPYQGDRKSFGEYECSKCGNYWYSPHSWANKFQQCQYCSFAVYPWRMSPLQPSLMKKDQKQNPTHFCVECNELNRRGDRFQSPLQPNLKKTDQKPHPRELCEKCVKSPSKPSPTKKDQKPHPRNLCEKCDELGKPCWERFPRTKYLSV